MKRLTVLLLILLSLTLSAQAAELSFSGDATLVSTYVWRGVTQFNGAAMQGTGEIGYGILAVGYWISTMQGDVAVETVEDVKDVTAEAVEKMHHQEQT